MFEFWLFVHIVATVVAFGPTYTFPAIAALARKNPKHAPFAAEITDLIEVRYVWPFVVLAGISGVAMIVVGDIPTFDIPWLYISIIIYAVAVVFSALVQTPNSRKMVRLAVQAAEAQQTEGAPTGPPPELEALGKKLQLGGMFLAVSSLIVFYLMIIQPDF